MQNKTIKLMRYTIVEMMMVIAVFMIILSMAMVAWLNSGNQAKLRNAARELSGMLNLARAKAVAERTTVGVYLSNNGASGAANDNPNLDGNPHVGSAACRLYYFEGTSRNGFVDYEEWHTLPGGITFDFTDGENKAFAQNSGNLAERNGYIVFNRRGQIAAHSGLQKVGNSYLISVAEGKVGEKILTDTSFYVISINEYSGRITSKFHEATE